MSTTVFRPGDRVHVISALDSIQVMRPRGGEIPWWLSGGIAAANCVAAYTPKGAASLAASYDNNAAPGNGLPDGTYDAMVVQGRTPAWSTTRGWYNDQMSCRGLTTSVYPAKGWSYIMRLTNMSNATSYSFGEVIAGGRRVDLYHPSATQVRFGYGNTTLTITHGAADLTALQAGFDVYTNGIYGGTMADTWTAGATDECGIFIMKYMGSWLPYNTFYTPDIYAVAIYNISLTAPQAAALSAAVMAL